MTWVKLDDKMPWHPKLAALSHGAFHQHIAGLCYCSQHLTDGHIPATHAHTLIPSGKRYATELVTHGLWESRNGGYDIHDYLDYQPSKQRIKDEREFRIERARAGGLAKAAKDAASSSASSSASSLLASTDTVPAPVPVKKKDLTVQEDSADEQATPRYLASLLEAMGEPERGQAHLELLSFKAKGASEADFRRATGAVRKKRPTKPRSYVATVLTNAIAERSDP